MMVVVVVGGVVVDAEEVKSASTNRQQLAGRNARKPSLTQPQPAVLFFNRARTLSRAATNAGMCSPGGSQLGGLDTRWVAASGNHSHVILAAGGVKTVLQLRHVHRQLVEQPPDLRRHLARILASSGET